MPIQAVKNCSMSVNWPIDGSKAQCFRAEYYMLCRWSFRSLSTTQHVCSNASLFKHCFTYTLPSLTVAEATHYKHNLIWMFEVYTKAQRLTSINRAPWSHMVKINIQSETKSDHSRILIWTQCWVGSNQGRRQFTALVIVDSHVWPASLHVKTWGWRRGAPLRHWLPAPGF